MSGLHRRGAAAHRNDEAKPLSQTHVEIARQFSEGDEFGSDQLDRPLLSGSSPTGTYATSSSSFNAAGDSRRRSQSAAPSSKPPSRWALALRETASSVACGLMDLLPSSIQLKFTPLPTVAQLRFIEAWRDTERIMEPYNKEHAHHVETLMRFWKLCFEASHRAPPPVPPELSSELWKEFGFQGVDPATDFRGGGFFSLQNLVNLASNSPSLFNEFVHRQDYPFAVAGINVTMILVTLLRLQTTQTCLATRSSSDIYSTSQARAHFAKLLAANDDPFLSVHERNEAAMRVFDEVYRLGCALVHAEWLKSNRNLMAFNSILREATKLIINILKVSQTVDELRSHFPPQLTHLM